MYSEINTTAERCQFDIEQFNADVEAFNKDVPSFIAAVRPDPEHAKAQKAAFLAGEVENPMFIYPTLATMTADTIKSYQATAGELLAQADQLNEPHRTVYEEFIEYNLQKAALLAAMRSYNEAKTPGEKNAARQDFMRWNVELFGEPDRITYLSLMSDKMKVISQKERSPESEALFQELLDLLPAEVLHSNVVAERFRPSEETIRWTHDAVTALYEPLLRHVTDTNEKISAEQLCRIFASIISDEFEAADWQAVQGNATSITVSGKTKRIIVPFNRAPVSAAEARRLVVHELGVHMMTAMMGEASDISALQHGLAGYDDTQEGIAKVAEQALDGEYKEAGIDHYITAGSAYFYNMDFRQVFEIKWRMKLLEDLASGEVPTEEKIAAIRERVFDGPQVATTRAFRGTNDLPQFSDLSYYNGSLAVWQYLEKICGDDVQLNLLLMGKRSLSPEHQRVVLEARTATSLANASEDE